MRYRFVYRHRYNDYLNKIVRVDPTLNDTDRLKRMYLQPVGVESKYTQLGLIIMTISIYKDSANKFLKQITMRSGMIVDHLRYMNASASRAGIVQLISCEKAPRDVVKIVRHSLICDKF